MNLNFSITRGDNAPPLGWVMPFDIAGSDFLLELTSFDGPGFVLTSIAGALSVDAVSRRVTWAYSSEQSLALAQLSFYKLRRIVQGGETRLYATGTITSTDSPQADVELARVPEQGPQGATGPAGISGASAYGIAVLHGFVGTEAEWLASLVSGGVTVLTLPITAASSYTAPHNFPYRPRAWLVDAVGAEVETDILYAPGQVTAIFPGPFTGTLYLG